MTPDRIPMEIVVVDRPGAGSGCACAGASNPELPRFGGDLDDLCDALLTVCAGLGVSAEEDIL